MKRYALTVDLKPNSELIAKYLEYHKNIWPDIIESINASGVLNMEIYHIDTRLFMIIDVNDAFSFEAKAKMDEENSKVKEWEKLMDQYQRRLPFAQHGEKWVVLNKIFKL